MTIFEMILSVERYLKVEYMITSIHFAFIDANGTLLCPKCVERKLMTCCLHLVLLFYDE